MYPNRRLPITYPADLHFYPRAHRQEYGPLMLQAFKDHYHDRRAIQGRIGIGFWLEVLADVTTSSLSEQWAAFQGGLLMHRIWKCALLSWRIVRLLVAGEILERL